MIIQDFIFYLGKIFCTPLSDLTGLEFITLLLVSISMILITGFLIYLLGKCFILLFKGTRNIISAKNKCQKIQCKVCGRTLDRCICQKNKNKNNASRLYNYHKEEREHKKEAKRKN